MFEASQQLAISEARIRSWIYRDLLRTRVNDGRERPQLVELGAVARLKATRGELSVPR